MREISKKVLTAGLGLSIALSPVLSYTADAAGSKSIWSESKNPIKKGSDSEKQFSEDTLVVKYTSPLSAADHKRAGTAVVQQIKGLNYTIVKVKNKKKVEQAMRSYQNNKKVESVNQSPKYQLMAAGDPKAGEQYALSMLHASQAQKLAGKNKVTVAVIDQGIDRSHPELKGSLLPSYNALNPMNPAKPDYHATHVAGIIGAKKDNGIGGYGINPNASMLSIDVFDGEGWTNDYTIAEGILYAIEKGAKVINMSLGGGYPSEVLEEAVEKAVSKGVVVVAAAGNDGGNYASYPAAYEGVISVSSVNSKKKLSSFSSYGASVDVAAPGEDIYAPYYDYDKKSTFASLSGTSMATPAVAASASLLLSKYPKLTPAQVEYILEQTATDLGTEGFDIKYGNGLVNPAAALKYDIKKLPVFVKEKWGKTEILKNAKAFNGEEPIKINNNITKPFEQQWIQIPVTKGEYIQTSLLSKSQFDYKLMLNFYGSESQLLEFNDVQEGGTEANLIQAPFTGVLAIGVKDVNGSFDDSGKNRSNYELNVTSYKELPKDESTIEAPIEAALPFKGSPYYLTGEKGDEDYFHIKSSEEGGMVNVKVSGIPGANIGLQIFDKEGLYPPAEEGQQVEEENGTVEPSPLYTVNNKGTGEGESYTFPAGPAQDYYIKVTSKEMEYENSYSGGGWEMSEYGRMGASQSMLPYEIKISAKVLPEDEDGLNSDIGSDEEDSTKMIEVLKGSALPLTTSAKAEGYIQSESDQDWYRFSPDKSGVYQFQLPSPSENTPPADIYEVVEYKDSETNETVRYLNEISYNAEIDWSTWQIIFSSKMYAGLTAGEDYYISIGGGETSTNFDPYQLTAKLAVENSADKYENNDSPENAKTLPENGIVTGNFHKNMDADTFYLAPKQSTVYTLKFERQPLTSAITSKYAEELLAPAYGMIAVTEDTNGNHKMDDNEVERTTNVEKILESGLNYGSFKAVKGKKYFITIQGFTDTSSGISLWPYKFTASALTQKDEDASSKVKNNVPSKPLSLKKSTSSLYTGTGMLNAGVGEGDQDWYRLNLTKKKTAVITLSGGFETDGVIEVYQKGKRVAKSDYYSQGDAEVLTVSLAKGSYDIKVSDAHGNASYSSYKLSVKLK